jgi:iron complex outermembrane receptor protein
MNLRDLLAYFPSDVARRVQRQDRHAFPVFQWYCLLAFLFLLSSPAFAQTSQLHGRITDPERAGVLHASVTLSNGDKQRDQTFLTNDQGGYTFANLQAGTYTLQVVAPGFKTSTMQIAVAAGQDTAQDIAMSLADAEQTVTVTAGSQGDAASGYRVDTLAQLGTLGSKRIVNTPYSISEVPSALIQNMQAKNLRDVIKYMPLLSFQEQQGSEIIRPETRGMQGSVVQNTRMNGMAYTVTGPNPMEDLQQLEAVNGLAGSMYGPANPSGMFNFIPKRPTDEPLREFNVDYDDKSIFTGDADISGRVGPNKFFGYRVNALVADGTAYVTGSHLGRSLAAAGFDIHPSENSVIELDYLNYHLLQRGYPGWFTYGTASGKFVELVNAPDPTREGYGQSYAGVNLTNQVGDLRFKHEFSPNWHLVVGVLDQRVDRIINSEVNNLTDSAGDYSASLATGFSPRFNTYSNIAYVNGQFHTGPIVHDFVAGSTGYKFDTYSYTTPPSAASVLLGPASVANPVLFPIPAAGLPGNANLYVASFTHQQGFNIGDTMTLTRKFLIRVAGSQDWIWVNNDNNKSVQTSYYGTNGVSPAVSFMYKPTANMTAYATYASSLQQGDIAPAGVVNAGQGLAPYRSTEWETGYKVDLPTINLTAALFRLERPFANINTATNVYEITGDQVNYGIELSAIGQILPSLSVYSGLTILDPKLTNTGLASTNDKQFVGIPNYKSNVLFEYRTPKVRGLVVSPDWQHVGRRPNDDTNSAWTQGYNVFDLTVRYTAKVLNKETTWRVGGNNLSNVHYWSTIAPGNITGTDTGSYTAFMGTPRTVSASATIHF